MTGWNSLERKPVNRKREMESRYRSCIVDMDSFLLIRLLCKIFVALKRSVTVTLPN